MRPLAPAPPNTVCRRSTSPSTICTRKAWSAMKPPWRTPAIRTTSSSKCKASIPQQMPHASKWSKPDLAPEERNRSTCKQPPNEIPKETLLDYVSFYFFEIIVKRRRPRLRSDNPQLPKSPKVPKLKIETRISDQWHQC